MANAIEARGLRKRFGKATALDGLDLTVAAGEVHAFLGPNGAGKTTTIRILRRLTAAGVRTLTCRPPTLEELFLRQYASQDHDSERNQVTQAP